VRDFGELLAAARRATRPSVVLLRSADRLTSDQQAALLAANLPAVANERSELFGCSGEPYAIEYSALTPM
jgi:hypothetical protein